MSIKSVKPGNSAYRQGYYNPSNPAKYVGNVNEIIYRSSWEKRMMIYLDTNERIIKWSSENVSIPYINVIDKKEHHYYPDFFAQISNNDSVINTIIEIKPYKQTKRPELKKDGYKYIKEYNVQLAQYIINCCKWEAANNFAISNNMKFLVITENDYPLKK